RQPRRTEKRAGGERDRAAEAVEHTRPGERAAGEAADVVLDVRRRAAELPLRPLHVAREAGRVRTEDDAGHAGEVAAERHLRVPAFDDSPVLPRDRGAALRGRLPHGLTVDVELG